ncbi:hypothetical protein GCM10025770_29530 [Viridibacterium curvum]|uniref:Uncharacterized protein n=1 Tax=Viridibacterium curvum TaxID=1101404 RepID=A0ABP9QX85_9RHOO
MGADEAGYGRIIRGQTELREQCVQGMHRGFHGLDLLDEPASGQRGLSRYPPADDTASLRLAGASSALRRLRLYSAAPPRSVLKRLDVKAAGYSVPLAGGSFNFYQRVRIKQGPLSTAY